MKIQIFKEDETPEEFEKISQHIVYDLVNMRGMPTDDGQYMRSSVEELKRDETTYEIYLAVHRVKCSRHEDF